MIYGSQWDAIMNWMSDVPNPTVTGEKYINNSAGMGWYYDNVNSTKKGKTTGTELFHSDGTILNCVKNIYDLAGNYGEWTQEANYATDDKTLGTKSGMRVCRGGWFSYKNELGDKRPASYRKGDTNTSVEPAIFLSTRLQLYIK